ncbi:MAG: DUF2283 domain-containing protein [Nanoarchaeota archaeon]
MIKEINYFEFSELINKLEIKQLNAIGKGEMDYDYSNDILFFKVKNREYDRSIELEDIVLDLDKQGFITGIQIFGASTIFKLEKETLQNIKKWEFHVQTEGKVISIQLMFEMIRRNKIIERGQNLVRETSTSLQDSEVLCAVA